MPPPIVGAMELLDVKDTLLPAVVDKLSDDVPKETSSVCWCAGCSAPRKAEASVVCLF